MELGTADPKRTDDNFILSLTQINQYNQNLQNKLDEAHLKNNEDLEELILPLIFLIHDLSWTFCEKLRKAAETIQSTFHLLNGLHKKIKDSVIEESNRLLQLIRVEINDIKQMSFQVLLDDTGEDWVKKLQGQKELDHILKCGFESGMINENELEFMTTPFPVTLVLYVLPKVHKTLTKPPGRPIVSARDSLCSNVAIFIDHHLQPVVKESYSFILDSSSLIRKLLSWETLNPGDLLVTMDVDSLYTTIPHGGGIQAPTDKNSLLLSTSYHPGHQKRGVVSSQLTRVVRNNTLPETRRIQEEEMVNKLEQRGYGRKLIKKVYTELAQQDQKSLLLPQGVKKNVEDVSDNINFVTTFNPISKFLAESVKKNWEIVSSDKTLPFTRMKAPRMVYKRAPNLKDILVHNDPTKCYEKGTWLDAKRKLGCYRCGDCTTCNSMLTGMYFHHPHTGRKYKILHRLSCLSTYVIYVLMCPCSLMYVGKTSTTFHERMANHHHAIRLAIEKRELDQPVARHFIQAGHTAATQTDYLIAIKEILGDTEKHLKFSEEQLNNISTQYKEKRVKAEEIQNVTKVEDVDGIQMTNRNSEFVQAFELNHNIYQEESNNKHLEFYDEIDNTQQIMKDCSERNTNEAFPVEKKNEEISNHFVRHNKNEDVELRHTEPTEPLVQINSSHNQETKPENKCHKKKKMSLSGEQDQIKMSGSEVAVYAPRSLNLSVEQLVDSGHWQYKEYMSQVEEENEPRLACFIKAPLHISEQLQCRFRDDISSLVVTDSEELVSSVLDIWSTNPDLKIPFPISIAIPFNSRYRGNYKDIMVKANDEKLQSSYLTPISLEGNYGNHKGSFAEVKVYKLGMYSVVSCLKKERFTVLKKGLSLKLNMDPRISFIYPPSCFSSSVIVQFKVQPIDTSIISLLKVKHDIYHSVVSSSPLVYVKHPSVHVFKKYVTVLLPCPPNPEKKKQTEDGENKRASTAAGSRSTAAQQIRSASASVRKHGENQSEFLKLLVYKDDQWSVLDEVIVRNVQNGIVSFEINEHPQSFIVIRLSSAMENGHLISLTEKLEEATHSTMVNVVLYRKKDNLQKAIVEMVPSKELTWIIPRLREEGYTGPPEPSEQISLQEGEQLHFRFCGNITASDGKEFGKTFKLTFHSQRKRRLHLHLRVVDEFGNHSSPLYKGTVVFHKLSRQDIVARYKGDFSAENFLTQRAPNCKLALTLPKVEKNVSRPSSTKVTSSDATDILWDNLLLWMAKELTEEDASLLVLSLPIRRSTIQLVKLKSPDNLKEQIYELLSFWKRSLPTSADKLRLLSRHLRKIGRNDMLEKLNFKLESKVLMSVIQQ
ncbi:death domain-containing protein 1 [Bombina bombina]|uniref:death domain-containing protein 1 n=1 Tax=Bombina bombina TaxID=8345 RepID=UPI00235AC057|nr:death domain-containing protein 1 [Bombina bombina]